jgi:hypothetical protein
MAPTTTGPTITAPTSTTTTTATTLPPPATGTTAASPVPIVISLLALFVALWSAHSSHRSRRAAERTAGLTEQRRQEEQAPSVEYVGADAAPEEGIRIANPAAVPYTSVRFTIVPSRDEPAPVDALKVDYDEPGIGFTQRWIVEGETWDLGSLGPGEPRLLDLRRPDQRARPTTAGTLRLILDCTTTRNNRVSVIRTCDIPPRPPTPFATWR